LNVADRQYCLGRGVAALTVGSSYSREYIELQVDNLFDLMRKRSQGGVITGLTKEELGEINVLLPIDLNEQLKIAEILRACDEAIDKTTAKIEKLNKIKQGMMQDLFRYGIDERGQIRSESTHRFKDSPLGMIPEEWEVRPITDYLEIMTDYVANGSFASLRENVNVFETESFAYYVRLFDLRLGLGHKKQTYVDEKSYGFLKKSFLTPNDTLIANIGAYAGEVWIMPQSAKPATIAPNMLILKANDQCDKVYLFYFLKSEHGAKGIKNVIGGSGQPKISKTDLKTMKILKMNKTEQLRITSTLTSSDDAIEKEEVYKQKLLALKSGLMEDLLSGIVRVNHLIGESG
ncbi:restriction endonuclease subunit S, partial [Candidatus Omnitrophota bacterium]